MTNIPKLKKIESVKTYHDLQHKDEYSYVDQADNIIEVLKDPSKVIPEVRKYIDDNNERTKQYFSNVKDLQEKLFSEIKGKIRLDDISLKFKDERFYYWAKTEKKDDYGKRVRQLIDGSKPEEVFWNGDLEKKRLKAEYCILSLFPSEIRTPILIVSPAKNSGIFFFAKIFFTLSLFISSMFFIYLFYIFPINRGVGVVLYPLIGLNASP